MAAADVIDLCSSDEEQNDTQQISKIPLQQPHQAEAQAAAKRSSPQSLQDSKRARLPQQQAGPSVQHMSVDSDSEDDGLDLSFLGGGTQEQRSIGGGRQPGAHREHGGPDRQQGVRKAAGSSSFSQAANSQQQYWDAGLTQDNSPGAALYTQPDAGDDAFGEKDQQPGRKGRRTGGAKAAGADGQPLTKEEKAAMKAAEKQARLQQKEEEKAEKARAKAEAKAQKQAAKAAEKASKQEAVAVRKALTGRDAKKGILLRVSPRLMEAPWVAEMVSVLQAEGYEYKVDASLPLAGEYACVRWARRMPQAAAAAFLESQGAADVGPLESQETFLEPGSQGGAGAEVEVLMPCVLVFLPPPDLVAHLLGEAAGAAAAGGASAGGSHQQHTAGLMQGLRSHVSRAYPDCSLLVACVDLERHLTQRERAPGSVFNRTCVVDALMDMAIRFPAVRLREDLKDGSQAAEYLAGVTRGLAEHHRKQQDGYLAAFGENKLSASHPELEGVPQGTRTLAHAISQLLPPDKAIKVAKGYRSLGALLNAYGDNKNRKEKEALLVSLTGTIPGKGNIGSKASAVVYEYLTNADAAAPWKDAGE